MVDDAESAGNNPADVLEHESQSDDQVSPSQGGHRFTIATAAEACGVSEMTIKRGLNNGKFPNAAKELIPGGGGTERWNIPLADLLGAGYKPNQPKVEVIDLTDPQLEGDSGTRTPLELPEVIRLRQELEHERERARDAEHRAQLAESIAAERDRALEMINRAMRQLEAGSTPTSVVPAPTAAAATATRKRGWLRRRKAEVD